MMQRLISWSLIGIGIAAGGCKSAPKSDPGGRGNIYNTSLGERGDAAANIADLAEFTDATLDRIVTELAALKKQLAPDTQYVLYLGELENHAGSTTTTADFEMFQKRLRSRLVSEPRIRDVFAIRNNPTDTLRQASKVAAPPPADNDLLQDGPRSGGGLSGMNVAVDPNFQFVLRGDFYSAVRSGRTSFLFNFQVVHVGTGDIVISSDKELKRGN